MNENDDRAAPQRPPEETVSKKEQIIALYLSGMREVEDLAVLTGSSPSYVGSVLQNEGLTSEYFDLYTSTSHPMNVYSKFFAGRLGFKDVETARESVAIIDQKHHQFALARDRAGQHHALVMALTMYDRARWTGKQQEAEVFRRWLAERLGATAGPAKDEGEAGFDEGRRPDSTYNPEHPNRPEPPHTPEDATFPGTPRRPDVPEHPEDDDEDRPSRPG